MRQFQSIWLPLKSESHCLLLLLVRLINGARSDRSHHYMADQSAVWIFNFNSIEVWSKLNVKSNGFVSLIHLDSSLICIWIVQCSHCIISLTIRSETWECAWAQNYAICKPWSAVSLSLERKKPVTIYLFYRQHTPSKVKRTPSVDHSQALVIRLISMFQLNQEESQWVRIIIILL